MNLTGYLFDAANWTMNGPLLTALGVHALISLILLVAGGLLGIGLGSLLGAFRGSRPVVQLLSWIGGTVPALGLIVVAAIVLGAELPVLAGCLLLLITLAVAGATARALPVSDRNVIESGRAMGLSRARLFFGYRIALVLPRVLRTLARVGAATVTMLAVAGTVGVGTVGVGTVGVGTVGVGTVGTGTVGAPGLGELIRAGFDAGYPQVFAGAVLLIGLGWVFYLLFAGLGWAARRRVA